MEHQFPARSQQPGCLGDPSGRIAPQAGSAFGDSHVEAARRQRDIPCVGLNEREGDAEPVLAALGGFELGGSHVYPGRPGAAAGQPRGEVRRPAAEFDDVKAADVTEYAELMLGHVEDAPGNILSSPGAEGMLTGVFTVCPGPQLPVGRNLICHGPSLSHPSSPPQREDVPMPR
jgi:hypothetical protein